MQPGSAALFFGSKCVVGGAQVNDMADSMHLTRVLVYEFKPRDMCILKLFVAKLISRKRQKNRCTQMSTSRLCLLHWTITLSLHLFYRCAVAVWN